MTEPAVPQLINGLGRLALERPDDIAIVEGSRVLTYAELWGLAGTVARLILERRPADGVPVPVVVERGIPGVLAVWGALLAGAPMAIIDASVPAARLHEILTRLGEPAFTVFGAIGDSSASLADRPAVRVPATVNDPAPPQAVCPSDLGFVIFTSGSTGRPKGVMRDWGLLDRRVVQLEARGESAEQHQALLSPIGYLAGFVRVIELGLGGSLAIADPTTQDAVSLIEWMDEQRFTRIGVVPSMIASVLDHWPRGRRLESVRLVRTFGEALRWEVVPGIRELVSEHAMITAGYAASEASASLSYAIAPGDPLGTGRVPLGTPRRPDEIRLEQIDDEGATATQLLVGGTVALGYWGDPELTAARFVTDADGRRWWRSGDLAVQRDDGVYEHRGRIDDMVKINGMLVEPAEAERVIGGLVGVRSVAVLPHTTARGTSRLVAHLAVDDDAGLTPTGIRSALTEQLPRHLVPNVFVRHAELPLTDRGKVDRSTLRDGAVEPWRSISARPPESKLERHLLVRAGELLGLRGLTIDDDLWEQGLDSLLAVELLSGLADAGFGDLDPGALIDLRTPAAIARALESGRTRRPSVDVRLNPRGARAPIFCVAGAGGTALGFRSLAEELGSDQPLVVFEPRGLNSRGRPDRSVESAARRYLHLVEREVPDGPYTLAGYSAGATIAYEMARALHERGAPVHLVLLDGPAPWGSGNHTVGRAVAVMRELRGDPSRDRMSGIASLGRRVMYAVRLRANMRVAGWRPARRRIHYDALYAIWWHAARRYEPVPAEWPVTVIQPPGSASASTWGSLLHEPTVHEVPGDHFTMLGRPAVAAVAEHLQQAMCSP